MKLEKFNGTVVEIGFKINTRSQVSKVVTCFL